MLNDVIKLIIEFVYTIRQGNLFLLLILKKIKKYMLNNVIKNKIIEYKP